MVIVVHKGVDLDAFGSALGLSSVFGAKVFLPEPKNRNVAELVKGVEEYLTSEVDETVIFCDTDSVGNWKAEYIFDHHGTVFGANSSAVTLWLNQCGYLMRIPDNIRCLLLSGIYEDTGFLRYDSTKPLDLESVKLLRQLHSNLVGMDVHISPPLSEAHFSAIYKIIERQEQIGILGNTISLSYVYEKETNGEISSIVQLLQATQEIDAYVLLVGGKNRVLGICRARENVPLWDLLASLNPVGHRYAFIFRSRGNVEALFSTLPELIREEVLKYTLVSDITLSKVTLIEPLPVASALQFCRQYGLSVVCLRSDHTFFYITRQDLERLNRLGYGERNVLSFSEPFPCFKQDEDLSTAYPFLKRRMPLLVEKEDGFYIATTDDLIRQGVLQFYENPSEVLKVGEQVYNQIGPLLSKLTEKGVNVYLVGGAIRDYLLGKEPDDIDLSFEGDVEAVYNVLCSMGISCQLIPKTFSVKGVLNGTKLEFTRARKDYYEKPGILSEVAASDIIEDLERRDFTINAIALQLNPGVSMLDPFQGLSDLKRRTIKLIKRWSILEDPSRAFRAINYKNKLNFTLAPELEEELRNVNVKGKPAPRVLMEFRDLMRSSQVFQNIKDIVRFDLMRFLGESFLFDDILEQGLSLLEKRALQENMDVRTLSEYAMALIGLGFRNMDERKRFFKLLGSSNRFNKLAEELLQRLR